MRNVIIILAAIGLCSCVNTESTIETAYYNTDSLLAVQRSVLSAGGYTLDKTAIVGKDSSQVKMSYDSTLWREELAIFQTIDITRPAYRGLYTLAESDDSASNLRIRSYLANNDELEVRSLRLYYLDNINNLKKLTCTVVEKNPIYNANKVLEMNFAKLNNEVTLTSYQIAGMQKMVLQDTLAFQVNGMISFE